MLKDKIVELRKANNDTQDCLAKKLSVSRSLIAKWEQGRAVPNATYIKKIYEIYNVSYDQMIKLDEILSYKKKGDKKFIISVIIGELILLTSISIVFLINDLVFNFKKISLLYFIAFLFFVLAIIFIIFVNAKKYVKNVDFNGKIVVPTLITLSSVFFHFILDMCIEFIFYNINSLTEDMPWKICFIIIELVFLWILNIGSFNLVKLLKSEKH